MRYQVVEKSISAHCCFEATVIDTHNKGRYIHDQGQCICECFEVEDARKVADALNNVQSVRKATYLEIAGLDWCSSEMAYDLREWAEEM